MMPLEKELNLLRQHLERERQLRRESNERADLEIQRAKEFRQEKAAAEVRPAPWFLPSNNMAAFEPAPCS